MAPFPMTLVTCRFQGHKVTIDALDVLCAQLTRNLFAIAKFLVQKQIRLSTPTYNDNY